MMLDDPNAFFLYAGLVGGVLLAIFGIRAGLRRDNTEDWVKLNQLAAKGVNLEARRQVEFVLLVRTEPSAQHVAQQLLSDGFVTRFERGGCQVHRGGAVANPPNLSLTPCTPQTDVA